MLTSVEYLIKVNYFVVSDEDAGASDRKNNVSYLVLVPSLGRGNKTSSLGFSPADDGKLLLLLPDAPTSTVALLQKDKEQL